MNKKIFTLFAATLMGIGVADAQLNQNSCKFLGNITTRSQIQPNVGGLKYEALWDQLTCENETKWGSIVNCKVSSAQEGIQKWNWATADSHYKWCKQNGVQFKFHALFWTSQWPHCLANCTPAELRKQAEYWVEAVSIKYPDLTVIDVVNEAIRGHAEGKETEWGSNVEYDCKAFKNLMSQALGNSTNPYDYKWIVEAFKIARKYFPNTVLVYNDFNTFTWQKDDFINLVSSLVQQGAPIDAYGHQSHDLDDYYGSFNINNFGNTLKEIHNGITQKSGKELQCYITEYDISQGNESTFETIMEKTFKPMWEADFVSGITIWGFVNGATWRDNTGLVTSTGQDRSGMKWLRNYMQTNTAKNAKAKFCGKAAGGASVSVEVSASTVVLGNSVDFSIKLSDQSGIKSVAIYDGNEKIGEGEKITWTPEKIGDHAISVVVITNDGKEVKGSANVKVVEPNKPYGGTAALIPGKIEAENYDEGEAGMAYSDASAGNTCDDFTNFYRKDDVDIKEISDGAAVGSFQEGEWMSYTVDVLEDGEYNVTMRLGEGNDSGSLSVELDKSNVTIDVKVNKLGAWGVFEEVELDPVTLKQGEQTMIIRNTGSWIDVDWIKFEKVGGGTGINNVVVAPITIGPNPASSTLSVYGATPISVAIISLDGIVVKESGESNLSVADIPNGNYIVRVITETGVTIKKLVVEK